MEQIVLTQCSYVQICVTDEQKFFARNLVEHSLRHHHVSNIWDKQESALSKTRMMRFTGSLGEIVFADTYHLPRPTRSFGAIDGQDRGQDFLIRSGQDSFSIDVKSMKRKSGNLSGNFVLNIPASQLKKYDSKTTHYFCISFHQSETEGTIASLLGFVDKHALQDGQVGTVFKAGTKRLRFDESFFIFNEDTFEIPFADIDPPVVTDFLRQLAGFRICDLKV